MPFACPLCAGLGGWNALNKVLHHDSWLRSRRISLPLGRLAAQSAMYQISKARHFLAENPFPSDVFTTPEWQLVKTQPGVASAVFHQCRTGLSHKGALIKKPTELVASSEVL